MIQKVIHYCWFGGSPPQDVIERVNRWRAVCPDYEVVEWNNHTYPLHKNTFLRQAVENEKWSFASDYARLDILAQHGGIYLDTDVDLLRPFDDLLCHECFLGMENDRNVALCTIGAEPDFWFLRDFLALYERISLVDADGYLDLEPNVRHATKLLVEKGLQPDRTPWEFDGLWVYPADYFVAKSYSTGRTFISERTYAVHQFSASWMDERRRNYEQKVKLLKRVVGIRAGRAIVRALGLRPPKERAKAR